MLNEEPDCRGAALIISVCFVGLLLSVAFVAWAYFKEEAPAPPIIIEVVSEEGQAKAMMIEELTGLRFTPDVAKYATVTFSGTTVQIETHAINIWEGRHAGWREKK